MPVPRATSYTFAVLNFRPYDFAFAISNVDSAAKIRWAQREHSERRAAVGSDTLRDKAGSKLSATHVVFGALRNRVIAQHFEDRMVSNHCGGDAAFDLLYRSKGFAFRIAAKYVDLIESGGQRMHHVRCAGRTAKDQRTGYCGMSREARKHDNGPRRNDSPCIPAPSDPKSDPAIASAEAPENI